MKNYVHRSKYFYGNKISKYGLENGYVDYRALALSFDAVLNNGVANLFYRALDNEFIEPELYNGSDYDEENEYYYDIFQYFIISEYGAEILSELTDEIVYYLPALDMYIWGVTHCGTSWDYVLTDIKIELEAESEE